jgi:hypothetical protein
MFTGSKSRRCTLAALLAFASGLSFSRALAAQARTEERSDNQRDNSGRWLAVKFPEDSPVLAVSLNMGATTARPRGVSMAIDLHAALVLRNVSKQPISSLTLRVEAQDLTPAGKGSVIIPSLYVQPGEVFPVRIDMQILRPFNVPKGDSALVEVSLDCALFNNLSSYGPDKLHSLRALLVYELEARRDRRYLTSLLATNQLAQLREELNFGLPDAYARQLGLELLRGPRAAAAREQPLTVDTVSFPGSPVQPIGGAAQVAGNEVRIPRVQVRNNSQRPVRSIELGWIVRDEQGTDFLAGSLPSSVPLGPVETANMTEPATLRFSRAGGQPMVIGALMAFVNNVEFADGKLWIPSRVDIAGATSDPALRREIATSPEQQRLAEIYRRKGTTGLADELKRVNAL